MNTFDSRSPATRNTFESARRKTRIVSALLSGVFGIGIAAGVVNGISSRSDGMALGDFVASRLVAEQPVVAAAPARRGSAG